MEKRDFGFGVQTPLERLLSAATALPGGIGRSAGRKLVRRLKPRAWAKARADFDLLLGKVGPDDVLLDLGANVGAFTEVMAASGAAVHAYEPDPYASAQLTSRVGSLPNVRLFNEAVSATSGQLTLTRHRDFQKDPALYSVGSSIYFTRAGGEGVTVDVVSFDEALARCGKPAAIIKMDIEGAEFDILERVFSQPERYDFGALFVETHERSGDARCALVEAWRSKAETHARYINLFWP